MDAVSRVSRGLQSPWAYSNFKDNNTDFSFWKIMRSKDICHWFQYIEFAPRSDADNCYELATQESLT